MDNKQVGVSKSEDFGSSIVEKSTMDGSKPIIAPFVKLFSSKVNGLDLRDAARKDKPMVIADIAHYLCVAHGKHPGVIEYATSKIVDDCSREWLIEAANGFVRERIYLTDLTVAAGPISRLTGQDETDMLIINQSKHYQMLASSDRRGCPIGASTAFVLDWHNIRPLIDRIALQLNVSIPELAIPSIARTQDLLEIYADSQNIVRAINFGVDQILSQQRAFWNIISARAAARNAK